MTAIEVRPRSGAAVFVVGGAQTVRGSGQAGLAVPPETRKGARLGRRPLQKRVLTFSERPIGLGLPRR